MPITPEEHGDRGNPRPGDDLIHHGSVVARDRRSTRTTSQTLVDHRQKTGGRSGTLRSSGARSDGAHHSLLARTPSLARRCVVAWTGCRTPLAERRTQLDATWLKQLDLGVLSISRLQPVPGIERRCHDATWSMPSDGSGRGSGCAQDDDDDGGDDHADDGASSRPSPGTLHAACRHSVSTGHPVEGIGPCFNQIRDGGCRGRGRATALPSL
ncbi:MAG: hypothetical protein M1826_007672 [Phylliscum demangeonii]|nr:MAG: hypothetical protein M1826_007672 [Phylliscum demangeonii]